VLDEGVQKSTNVDIRAGEEEQRSEPKRSLRLKFSLLERVKQRYNWQQQQDNAIKTSRRGVLIADTPSIPLPFSIDQKASHSTSQSENRKIKQGKSRLVKYFNTREGHIRVSLLRSVPFLPHCMGMLCALR